VDPSSRSNNVPPAVASNVHQANGSGSSGTDSLSGNKRLHVSNIPFRFREPDLRDLFSVSFFINGDLLLCLVLYSEIWNSE